MQGGCSADIVHNSGEICTVTAKGFIPFTAPFRVQRVIQVTIKKSSTIPENFYNNALYVAGNILIASTPNNSCTITGNIIHGGEFINVTGNTYTSTHEPGISPLAGLSFNQLRAISQSQNNYHDAQHLDGPFPASFWYDEDAGIPNVVFLEGDLSLVGNTPIGGFFVVLGGVGNTVISGDVTVNGCIYTLGSFIITGGNGIHVNGGVWVGSTAVLSGSISIVYNAEYMQAIRDNMSVNADVQIISWQEAVDQENG